MSHNQTNRENVSAEGQTRSAKASAKGLGVAILVLGLFLFGTPAHAYQETQSGRPGTLFEGRGFVHCGADAGGLKVGIEGIQTWASPATSDSQQVQAEAFIYRWDGSRFVHVGTQGPTRAWTRVGYGAVTFGHSVWSVGRGYYTISLRVKWFTASGALLGTKIIWPNATYDFTANRSWAGNPGFCQV